METSSTLVRTRPICVALACCFCLPSVPFETFCKTVGCRVIRSSGDVPCVVAFHKRSKYFRCKLGPIVGHYWLRDTHSRHDRLQLFDCSSTVVFSISMISGHFVWARAITMYILLSIGPAKSTCRRCQGNAGYSHLCRRAFSGAQLVFWQL